MEKFQSRGRLTAGVSFDIPGMGYKNPRTGEIESFEPDLAREIAVKLLGAPDRVDFVQVTDVQRFPDLRHDLVDMVLSQITITADRAREMDFTVPYHITHEAILVLRESPITRFEDLKGKRIAVTKGSVSIGRMRVAVPDAKLIVMSLNDGCLEAVEKGEADAASNDRINLHLMQKSSGQPDRYRIVDIGDRFEPKPYGIAIKKGNRPFVGLLNEAIESLKAGGDIEKALEENIARVGAAADRRG